METWLISALSTAIGVIVTAVVVVVAIRRTRSEPRRLSNAYWLLGATLLAVQTAASLGVPGSGLAVAVIGLIVITAPLLVLALAVFCVLNGAVMLRRESLSLGNVLSLGLGLGLLALVGSAVPVVLSGVGWLVVAWLAVVSVAGYLGFQFAAFVGYSLLYPRLVRSRPASWVVVLGSALRADGTVPPLLAARVATGVDQARRREARLLIMSGGKGDDEIRPEAVAMADHALTLGADPARLRREDRSRSTEQNLRFSAEVITDRPALPGPGAAPVTTEPSGEQGLIVTSNYHVLRAAMLARRIGLPAQAYGAPTAGYFWPSAMIREFIAVLAEHRLAHLIMIVVVTLPVLLLGLVTLVR